jgi:flagellar biosynthesis anti-sigma factor FlgM
MKVPGSEIKDALFNRAQDARNEKAAGRKQGASAEAVQGSLQAALDDTMQISSVGTMLKSELDPAKMAEERRAKIEALKEQIKNGTYKPPMEGVARALGEEVSLEILLSGGVVNGAE